MEKMIGEVNDPLTWIGLGFIVMVALAVTIDVLVIPTMMITIASLIGWFIFWIYTYRQNTNVGIFLGVIFLVVGATYLSIIIKFRLWKWVAQEYKVPFPHDNQEEIISERIAQFNEGGVIAHTDLRPVGKIRTAGRTLDGLSEIGFISKGTKLKITAYVEGQYKVKRR